MDFQAFTDTFTVPCCVMEVEKNPDGTCGMVRIHRSNALYKEVMGPVYYDDMPYFELVPKDIKFEDFCFRAAHENRNMHAYVEVRALRAWVDQHILPLQKKNEQIGYCLFLFEYTESAETDRLAEVSPETASAVIRCCISLSREEELARSLQLVTRDICEISEADACRILLFNREKKKAVTISRHIRNKEGSVPAGLQGEMDDDIVASWEAMIGVSNDVIVKDSHDMKELEKRNPLWVANMRQYHVESLVLIPLKRGKEIIGYLYVINYNIEKTVEVKELIELMSFFLGMEISNHQMREELEYHISHDILTGVNSRSALWKKMNEGMLFQPYGIVNMDVNGLKEINDSIGHDGGDSLILDSVKVMKECFGEENIYRIGGDEFLALLSGCTREQFEEMVKQFWAVKTDVTKANISAGVYWAEDGEDMQDAMRYADQDMYNDKKKYYETHPDRRKR